MSGTSFRSAQPQNQIRRFAVYEAQLGWCDPEGRRGAMSRGGHGCRCWAVCSCWRRCPCWPIATPPMSGTTSGAEVFPEPTVCPRLAGGPAVLLISGFVICVSGWGPGVGSFLLSRAVRLYWAYSPSVLVVAASMTVFPGLPWRPTTLKVLVNLTMFQDAVGVPQIADVY